MDTDQNLLFAALCLQTGIIDSAEFAEACRLYGERPNESMRDVLAMRGWIEPEDKPHLDYFMERHLHHHGENAKEALSRLPEIASQVLAALDGLDSESTIAGSLSSADSGLQSVRSSTPAIGARYDFTRLHATGGIGRVWRAHDRQLDREVALKELRPEKAIDSKMAARFVREARLTGQLEHPGIVPVYELTFRTDSSEPYYTMRFVRGRTLTSAIDVYHAKRQAGKAEPDELITLLTALAAVCNTIAYAHSRGVLHRDLKGDNVMLGDFGEVIVLDWGLAKLMDQPDEETIDATRIAWDETQDAGLTLQGDIVGTPAYMAPEQAEGRLDHIDQRTDIYGLGGMLYEILTGCPPFTGSTTLEVVEKALRGNPVPPRELWPEVPPALEEACLKALEKDPARRYTRAEELAREVQRWQEIQRRRAEDALRRQTEILRSILNSMSEGVIVSDEAGKLILINPAAERMIGRSPEGALVGARNDAFYRPDRVTPFDSESLPSAQALRGEEVNDVEMFISPVAGGNGIWASANARPLRDGAGALRGSVVVFRDISERKRVEEELRASEEQYHSLTDLVPGVVWTARADGWIEFANQFWFEYTGMTLEQTQGSGWTAAIHPDDLERVSRVWTRGLETGELVEIDYRLKRADGIYCRFLARGKAVRDREGRIVKWFGLLTELDHAK